MEGFRKERELTMKKLILTLTLIFNAQSLLAGDFCLVQGNGLELCNYHTAEQCQRAAFHEGGICQYKPELEPVVEPYYPNPFAQPPRAGCVQNMLGWMVCN